jgi:hypothetical protein
MGTPIKERTEARRPRRPDIITKQNHLKVSLFTALKLFLLGVVVAFDEEERMSTLAPKYRDVLW